MPTSKLTPSQETTLRHLIALYNDRGKAVKCGLLAEKIERSSGTIRNQMQSLKALQLVEGFPGPKGGYKPTARAYETLDNQNMDDVANVPIIHESGVKTELVIEEIKLLGVHSPDRCRAKVQLKGLLTDIRKGDTVTLGPTPLSKLRIKSTVAEKGETENELILSIDNMQAPADECQH